MVENQKEYMALARRFDYIIEHKKVNDEKIPCQLPCNCCKLKRIFHKGSRDKFNRFEFLIRFNKDVTFKKAQSIIQDRKISGVLNMNTNGKVFFIGNPKPDKNDFIISPCKDDKECDYIYYNHDQVYLFISRKSKKTIKKIKKTTKKIKKPTKNRSS